MNIKDVRKTKAGDPVRALRKVKKYLGGKPYVHIEGQVRYKHEWGPHMWDLQGRSLWGCELDDLCDNTGDINNINLFDYEPE